MPTLNWIGKDAVINHHNEVPFHLLQDVPELSVGDPGSGNLIVEGDNLLALKALLPYYAGQVKCIYIDPPYNTGMDRRDDAGKRTGWIYNDNVNSPEIRAWLGRVVGEEAEDLSRHDKWLCMMYPRLMLLQQMLRTDGVIFISIDDIEIATLRFLLDEVFGRSNRVGTVVWKNATDNNPTQIASEHEYLLCYARDKRELAPEWKSSNIAVKENLLAVGADFIARYPEQEPRQSAYTKWFREHRPEIWPFQDYKFIDDEGIYTGMRSVHNPGKEGYRYDVPHPDTGRPCKEPMMGYRFPEETMARLLAEKRILFGRDENKIIELKVYVKDYRAKLSSLFMLDGRVGTNEIKAIFPESKRPFDFPKPTELIEELISFVTDEGDVILDSFAGSGTTGQATLQLNSADRTSRNFVMIEMEHDICTEITAERIRRVASGYENSKGERVEGLGNGFRYARLAHPLFNSTGRINEGVKYAELARHVFFSETGEPLPGKKRKKSSLLAVHANTAIYLLYNGILKDKKVNGGNVLTSKVLADLPPHDGPKVIYGTACRLSKQRLRDENILFKQIPYEIRTR